MIANALISFKDWFLQTQFMQYFGEFVYWVLAISATLSMLYFVIASDKRGAQFAIKCVVVYIAIKVVMEVIK